MNTSLMKNRRKELGMTQQDLADKCGLSKTTIYNYEKGRFEPTIENIEILAKVLRVEKFELLTAEPIEFEDSEVIKNEMKENLNKFTIKVLRDYGYSIQADIVGDLIKLMEGITRKVFLLSKAEESIVVIDEFRYSIISLEKFETIIASLITTIKLLTLRSKKTNEETFNNFLKTEKIFKEKYFEEDKDNDR